MSRLKEECGVFGVYDPDGGCAELTYCGLMALQHRGQESCGIAVNLNRDIAHYKDTGLVNEVFNEKILAGLPGTMGVGHVRYSTAGGAGRENAQPLVLRYIKGNLAIVHNGNLVNAKELKTAYERTGAIYQTTADTEIIAYTIARERIEAGSIEKAIIASIKKLVGAYSLVVMSPQKLIAARDPWGFRPLCIGQRGKQIFFASETCALDAVDAQFVREVEPGEVVVVEKGEIRSYKDNCRGLNHTCIFEYIYFARPDSIINGQHVSDSRYRAGAILAKEHPIDGDIVIGVPDSGVPAAMGYAKESGIPYGEGFVKNKYIARTFIKPTQASREQAVKLKLNPLTFNISGKKVIMVDDSIVRGTTCGRIVNLLRSAGAKEVHVRISSPPFLWPCYFGTDIPSKDQLVATTHTIEEIRQKIHADSLGYLSLKGLNHITPHIPPGFCDACFTGNYPVPIKEGL